MPYIFRIKAIKTIIQFNATYELFIGNLRPFLRRPFLRRSAKLTPLRAGGLKADKIGKKSGTSYMFCGDVLVKKKVIIRGYRKCHHNVRRHSLMIGEQHNGAGRQPGTECVPGKNTECPALLKFSLPGSHLHTSHGYKQSLTQQTKDMYPLEITLDFMHNHSINSADTLRYKPASEEVQG